MTDVVTNVSPEAVPTSYSPDDLEAMYADGDIRDEPQEQTSETGDEDSQTKEVAEVAETDSENQDLPVKPESRTFKVKNGDSEVDINEDAVIFKKIDGKEVPVKIKEALDNYAGQVAWDKRFQELDRDRKLYVSEKDEFNRDRDNVNTRFSQIAEVAKAGQPQAALRLLAEMSGQDPVEFEKSYLENFGKIAQTFLSMTPEQKELYYLRQREEYKTKQLEQYKQKAEQEQTEQGLRARVAQAAETAGIPFEDFVSLAKELKESEAGKGRDIQVEDVVRYHQHVQAFTVADKVMQQAGIEPSEALENAIVRIVLSDPEMTESDLVDIVKAKSKQASPSEENLSRKVQSAARSGNRTASTPQVTSKKENQEPESWDDL
jgi:hypothetical protein